MELLGSAEETRRAASPVSEMSHCDVAIMRNGDSEILVCGSQNEYALPTIDLPAKKRPAPILLSELRIGRGLNAICRFSLPVSQSEWCFVLDLMDPDQPLPAGQFWLAARDIRWDRLEATTRDLLWSVLAKTNAYASGKLAGHFVSSGWLRTVQEWTAAAVAPAGLRLTGRVDQYNIGPDFALLRFATTGRAVWFKAVGHPNCREFTITRQLTNLRLPHVPELIAVDEALHAWLMYEAPGTFAESCYSREQWKWIARSLAELQRASLPHLAALAGADASDLTILRLENGIEAYLDQVSCLMELQQAEVPRRLTSDDLRLIEARLKAACRRMKHLAIPDSIGHSDFNPGNIMVHRGEAVFLDWAQGHVGPPCLTFEYLLLLVARNCPADPALLGDVREEYLSICLPALPKRDVAECFSLSPLLAVYAYALVCHEAYGDLKGAGVEGRGFLRSLARRISREAQAVATDPVFTGG